ncbi:alpha/beta fold hydrolase [Mucilaginibacter endophyticus]|uniref:alpha/beta fold hydrolase n=1 Tax=Mucilaginibacter endophyticus TaxID=2675003 RepID=UPI001FC95579|nr:alpha/beta hydrolase [Mucilaginibacter endophyticus]
MKLLAAVLMIGSPFTTFAQKLISFDKKKVSDAALVSKLPGFKNGYAKVNGTTLHYVSGGNGKTLVLLPGWPETWWEFHKMMPALAKDYHVIAIDIRGMGSSSKPTSGYDKKTMAQDVYELLHSLGIEKAYIAGHDIGSMVAYSVAENHPDMTEKLILMDVPHPDPTFAAIPILPAKGTNTEKLDPSKSFLWWFAFNSVDHMPEDLVAGRMAIVQKYIFRYLLKNESAIGPFDKAVYNTAYDSKDGIRAGNGWYKAFPQDIEDFKTYHKVEMPVLAIGGAFYGYFQFVLPNHAVNYKLVQAEGSGHFIPEEKPEEAVNYIREFLR